MFGQDRQFTVQDSIAWGHIVNFSSDNSLSYYEPNPRTNTALFSPDGKHFLVHVRHGDIANNSIVEELLEFDTDEVTRCVLDGTSKASQRVLSHVEVKTDLGEMTDIKWLDNNHLAYIADSGDGISQAFVVYTQTLSRTQLTHSQTSVVSFAVSDRQVLYYARTIPKPEPLLDVVDDSPLTRVLFSEEPSQLPTQLFVESRADLSIRPLSEPTLTLPLFRQIWMAPSGRQAIIMIPVTSVPQYWGQYNVAENAKFAYTPDLVAKDAASPGFQGRSRFAIVDLATGRIEPLMDAPNGWYTENYSPIEAFWPKDERSVIVSNSFLPLKGVPDDEQLRRAHAPAVAEISLSTREAKAIYWEPAALSDADHVKGKRVTGIIDGLSWDGKQETLSIVVKERMDSKTATTIALHRQREGTWMTVSDKRDSELHVDVRQDMNTPPKVFAEVAGRRKAVFDPNPQSSGLQFGHAEPLTWRDDANNVLWAGSVTYPADFVPGRRYPLVVQTHGFRSDEFLLDGPLGSTTCMAAQAFSNAGFVVLQIEDNPKAHTGDLHEGDLRADGYRAGIEYLKSKELVDPDKVGLIAWSRTGYGAIALMARYPRLLDAVDICDAANPGYLGGYMLAVNQPASVGVQYTALAGGVPDFDNAANWFLRNPLYRLGKTDVAVRLEADQGHPSVLGMWEPYTILRFGKRPVDFVYFSHGTHSQFLPAQRLGSQGGSVDWFRFWLQGYEDPDPTKKDQYKRWEHLRELRDADTKTLGASSQMGSRN